MPAVRIVSDNACDLPPELAARHGIAIVALGLRLDGRELVGLSAEEFWRATRSSTHLPETAAPAPGAFLAAFDQAAADGADAVICVTLSSKLSSTIASAQLAAGQVSRKVRVEVVDSTSVSLGQGLLVLGAAQRAEAGASGAEVAAWIAAAAGRVRVFGVLDTLDNLKTGGRVGGAKALVGSVLAIKPVIEIRDGEVLEESKQRTRGRSLHYLAAKVSEAAAGGEVDYLGVLHGDASDIEVFVELVAPAIPRERILISLAGPVIGAHAGPGVIGVAWIQPATAANLVARK